MTVLCVPCVSPNQPWVHHHRYGCKPLQRVTRAIGIVGAQRPSYAVKLLRAYRFHCVHLLRDSRLQTIVNFRLVPKEHQTGRAIDQEAAVQWARKKHQ